MNRFSSVIILALLASQTNGAFATVGDDVDKLDAQRNELVKEITVELSNGKLTIEEAQHLKNESDNALKLESIAREDAAHNPGCLQNMSTAIQTAYTNFRKTVHPTPVWLGVHGFDKTLREEISDALAAGRVNKEEAGGLKKEAEELSARGSNADPGQGFKFDDAMSLAVDIETFQKKLGGLVAAK